MNGRGTLQKVLLLLAGLTVMGLVSGTRLHTAYGYAGTDIPWADALGTGLLDWYLWGPLIPLILLLVRYLHPKRVGAFSSLAGHLVSGTMASGIQLSLFALATTAIREWRFGRGDLLRELRSGVLHNFHTGFLVYGALVFGLMTLAARREVRASELRRAKLDESLARSRMEVLEAHLRPHFLFNALNSVAALVRTDPDTAERMIVSLGKLLRAVIPRGEAPEPTLRSELDLVEGYLGIERARYGKRLVTEICMEPGLERALLPNLLLQPLVENAVRHGVAPVPAGGHVWVEAKRDADCLTIVVLDDGAGWAQDESREGGLGLAATRERMHLLHGDQARMSIQSEPGSGTRVVVSLPLRFSPRKAMAQ